MNKQNNLDILPVNFRHEKKFLKENKLDNWEILNNLSDNDVNNILQKNSLCTESRLKKIRAIAIFITKLDLTPYQAYLLLHSGIGSLKTLSKLNSHSLEQKIGRLERKMRTRTKVEINQKLLKNWIIKSKDLL